MKPISITVFIAVLLFSVPVAAGLNDLIHQNVEDADKFYEQTISPVKQKNTPARLWIHIRTEAQKAQAERIYGEIQNVTLEGRSILKQPIQSVDFGPQTSQLRYFKKTDEMMARQLWAELRNLLPDLQIADFSHDYAQAGWIRPGHFELWLSP